MTIFLYTQVVFNFHDFFREWGMAITMEDIASRLEAITLIGVQSQRIRSKTPFRS